MKIYSFGVDFDYKLFLLDGSGNSIEPSADAPTIRVYSSKPTIEQVKNGTGDIVGLSITTWSDNGNGRTIAIPAIDDPEPNEEFPKIHDYYLGALFTLETSGQQQAIIRHLPIRRITGVDNELSIVAADLEVYLSGVDSYVSEVRQANFITAANSEIRAELTAKRFEYAKIQNPDVLKGAVVAKTLMLIALDQIADGTDGFQALYDESKRRYSTFLASVPLYLDDDLDGEADSVETKMRYGIIEV